MKAMLRADRGAGLPIVYIPGIDGTGALMLGLEARLAAEFRLVSLAYELDGEQEQDSYAGLAASAARVIQSLGIQRCIVIAESFGGAVALQLALDQPQLVAGLMIVNSFAYYPERSRLKLAIKLSPLVPEVAFKFGRHWFAPRKLFGRRRDVQALDDFRALPGVFFDEGYTRRMRMIKDLDLRPRLAELRMPIALFAGDADRIVPSVTCMDELKEALSAATLEVLPGGGHLVLPLAEEPWPERVADLARRAGWTEELSPSRVE